MPLLVFGGSKHDAWFSAIVSTIIGILGGCIIANLGLKYPSHTIIQYSQQILGSWLGKILGLIYVGFFIFAASLSARDFSELFLNYVMPEMPITVFLGIIILTAAYALFTGLSAIGRMSELIVPFTLLVIIFGVLANIPNANYPPTLHLENDFIYLLKEAVWEVPFFGMAVSMLFLIPLLNQKTFAKRTILLPFIISGIATVLVAGIVPAVLGPYETTSINYPFCLTYQQIRLFESIPRFDMFFISAWIGISLLSTSLYYYLAVVSIQQLFRTVSYRKFIIPIGILIIGIAIFAFPTFHQFKQFFRLDRWGLIVIPAGYLVPSLLLLISWLKRITRRQAGGILHG